MLKTKKKRFKKYFIKEITKKIQRKGFFNIRSITKDFEYPKAYRSLQKDYEVTPDVTALKAGNKHYFEVALKTELVHNLVSKWMLLQQLAQAQGGKLHLYAPKGHKAFAQRIINTYNIRARIVSF